MYLYRTKHKQRLQAQTDEDDAQQNSKPVLEGRVFGPGTPQQ